MQALEPLSDEKQIQMEYEPFTRWKEAWIPSATRRVFNLLGIIHPPQNGQIRILNKSDAHAIESAFGILKPV
ncbi:MAG: hypothetical protein U0Z26_02320 [Anaerolineales bacterium]